MENEIMQCPFYVKLNSVGPNNTSHPEHKPSAYRGKGFQCFKVTRVDDGHRSCTGKWVTYITEDGYCLWNNCVEQIMQEEYEKERNIVNEFAIFN